MDNDTSSVLRLLPSVDALLERVVSGNLGRGLAPSYLAAAARRLVAGWRQAVVAGRLSAAELESLVERADRELEALVREELRALPRRVVNATGVVVHTNLGRAPWPELAVERASLVASRANTLEYDLAEGRRGRREAALAKARLLFPAAGGMLAVNNCAAAVLLALNTFCEGKEVVISRGELVEIGGSFRIPEVMAKSGGILREVGATNRTHLRDYEQAINERTVALLKVHPSNYRIVGFTAQPSAAELVALAHRHDLLVIEDLGTGLVHDLGASRPAGEQTVGEALEAGVDVVTVSGDKLFGGPQAGLIFGRAELVERMRGNPLYRALRPDKVVLAALDACFELYLAGEPRQQVPVLHALTLDARALHQRSERLAARLEKLTALEVAVVEAPGAVGGGAAPQTRLPGWAVTLEAQGLGASALEARLRQAEVPVIARVEEDRVLLDLRMVLHDEEDFIIAAVAAAMS